MNYIHKYIFTLYLSSLWSIHLNYFEYISTLYWIYSHFIFGSISTLYLTSMNYTLELISTLYLTPLCGIHLLLFPLYTNFSMKYTLLSISTLYLISLWNVDLDLMSIFTFNLANPRTNLFKCMNIHFIILKYYHFINKGLRLWLDYKIIQIYSILQHDYNLVYW